MSFKYFKYFFFFLFVSNQVVLPANELTSPIDLNRRINAHILIGDHYSACTEGLRGLKLYPRSKDIWITYLHALAKAGDEKVMLLNWKIFIEIFPEEQYHREILEAFAWAVIHKGSFSSSPLIRVTAMLGAFFSQDAQGVKILCKGLQDPNSFLRAAAAKLSSHFMDASLQKELLRLLKTEQSVKVRLEVIQAIGDLKMEKARKDLQKIIAAEMISNQEKKTAIEALVSLSDSVDRDQLFELVRSDQAGMRLLACEFISFFNQTKDVDLIYPLLNDPHAVLRANAFRCLGKMRTEMINGYSIVNVAESGLKDPDSTTAITAAWVLTLNCPEKGVIAFDKFLHHKIKKVRYLASAALASTGKYGIDSMQKAFYQSDDPYIKINLAIGLIGQRTCVKDACDCLYFALLEKKQRWEWSDEEGFRVLGPSQAKYDDAIPNYPEAVDQLTQLEILQILAMLHYSQAQLALKQFLKEGQWGISGMASALLLTEGDEAAVDLVRRLLDDPDEKIRVQAVLILALWGEGEEVVELLQDAYFKANRDLKAQILEGVGRIGSEKSLSFLVQRLEEPYQTLRIISAAALLECLYH